MFNSYILFAQKLSILFLLIFYKFSVHQNLAVKEVGSLSSMGSQKHKNYDRYKLTTHEKSNHIDKQTKHLPVKPIRQKLFENVIIQEKVDVIYQQGPCGGKTTGQDRLAVFFESLGWKVFRAPETATILLKGGIRFQDLNVEQVLNFQEDLLFALMKIEDVYIHLAESSNRNCLIVFDRGTMDGSAYIEPSVWNKILENNSLNPVDLRDNRYDQIVHMVSAAVGAEAYYSLGNNLARSEGLAQASEVDLKTREVWVGHPYVDIIDNKSSRNFEDKILKMIQVVCDRAGVHYGDRLAPNSKKRKYLVISIDETKFPKYEEFYVVHSYLRLDEPDVQARIRKRGQNGKWCYTHTTRRITKGENVETRMQITNREYNALKEHADPRRTSTFKKRRCFFYEQQYFHLDIFVQPMPQGLNSLMILETYTTNMTSEFRLPPFLRIDKEITTNQRYSLYTLSVTKEGMRSARESESDANFSTG